MKLPGRGRRERVGGGGGVKGWSNLIDAGGERGGKEAGVGATAYLLFD